jgi:tetratricopeptide (TPR) repeat protein
MAMEKFWQNSVIPRLFFLFILILLLGISARPHEIRRGFELARQAQGGYNPQTADKLAQIADHLPWRADLWEQAAITAFIASSPEQAIEYFKNTNPLSPQGQLFLGDAYIQTENFKQAIQVWETLINEQGPSEEALARLSEAYLHQENYNQAINLLKDLLDLQNQISSPKYPIPQTYSNLGMLLAAHNPASAPPYLLQAAELAPRQRAPLRQLAFTIQRALPKNEPAFTLLEAGRQLGGQGLWHLAEHAFQQATQLRPDYAEAWAYLGEAVYHNDPEHPENSLSLLQHALALDVDSLSANTFLALYWQRQGDHQQSQTYIQLAASLDESNTTLQVYLGEISAQLGDLETAQKFYDHAIQLDPYDAVIFQSLAEFSLRYNLDTQQIAIPAARQAVLLAPNDPASLDVMGQVLFRTGDYLNASRFYFRALEKDSQFPKAHLHLGLLYIFLEETSQAREHLSLVITLAPDSASAAHAQRLLNENSDPNH